MKFMNGFYKCMQCNYFSYLTCLIYRREAPDSVFKDIDPTYNSTVLRSDKAPPLKFDNIMYDAERHPSGVYDVPRSNTTTPGVSRVAPPEFASHVRVEIENDDDDGSLAPTTPSVFNADETSENTTGAHSYTNMNADIDASQSQNGGSSLITPTYAYTYMDKPPTKAESYVTLNGDSTGQPKTVLGNKSPPQLPPRSQSMLAGMDMDSKENQTSHSNAVESQTQTQRKSSTLFDTQKQPQVHIYSEVNKPTASSNGDINSLSTSRQTSQADQNATPSTDSVFEPDTDYYRSLQRNMLVSGNYDNNMSNVPNSPYCFKQFQ